MFIFLHSPFLVRQHPREEQNEHVHTPSALPSHKYLFFTPNKEGLLLWKTHMLT